MKKDLVKTIGLNQTYLVRCWCQGWKETNGGKPQKSLSNKETKIIIYIFMTRHKLKGILSDKRKD